MWSEVKVAPVVSNSLQPHRCPWNSPGQNTGVGSLSLLQGIFPTQGLNPGLPHCKQILHQLNKGKPKNTGMGSLTLLQRIFLTQESNWGLLRCRRILYQLSSLIAQLIKNPPAMQETPVRFLGQEDPLEKG